jgi:hypothetical protein
VKQLEGDGRHNKEVEGDDLCGVVLKKRFPALSGSPLRSPGHISLNGRFRDFKSKLQHFAIDSRSSPERVVSCHLFDQVDLGLRNLWSAGF